MRPSGLRRSMPTPSFWGLDCTAGMEARSGCTSSAGISRTEAASGTGTRSARPMPTAATMTTWCCIFPKSCGERQSDERRFLQPMTNLEHYDFCKPYIMDGEYILWEGAPEKGLSLTSRDIVLLPFSVIWLGFALFWEYLAVTTSRSPLMVVWGLPF